jgi:protein TonB
MFADSLLESHWAHRSRRAWTTLLSFTLQALGVGILLLLPWLYIEGLPQVQWLAKSLPPAPPPGPPPGTRGARSAPTPSSNLFRGHILQIDRIPTRVQQVIDSEAPPSLDSSRPWVPGGTGDPGSPGNILHGIGTGPTIIPKPPPPVARPVVVSHMMEGNLIYKPQPLYPPLARAAHVQGSVVLRAIISKTGAIENLQVLSGHPMLVRSAMEAVSQWRYRPYVLNGDPVAVGRHRSRCTSCSQEARTVARAFPWRFGARYGATSGAR